MIETGTYNLIYIMTKLEESEEQVKNKTEYKLMACIAIRKATSCRVVALLDSFVNNCICEALVKILDDIG